MNTNKILRLADFIESSLAPSATPKIGFNMCLINSIGLKDMSGRGCGTTGCIAGWYSVMEYGEITYSPKGTDVLVDGEALYITCISPSDSARAGLGLSTQQAASLFKMNIDGCDSKGWSPGEPIHAEITPAMAARVLRHLARTGEVDWSMAYEPVSAVLVDPIESVEPVENYSPMPVDNLESIA